MVALVENSKIAGMTVYRLTFGIIFPANIIGRWWTQRKKKLFFRLFNIVYLSMWDPMFATFSANLKINLPLSWVNAHTCDSPVVSFKQRLAIAAIHVWHLYFGHVVVMVVPINVAVYPVDSYVVHNRCVITKNVCSLWCRIIWQKW